MVYKIEARFASFFVEILSLIFYTGGLIAKVLRPGFFKVLENFRSISGFKKTFSSTKNYVIIKINDRLRCENLYLGKI